MKPMLPTLAFDVPRSKDWLFEVKYDGFRAILHWDKEILLESRNGKSLLHLFPEIQSFLMRNEAKFTPFLPLLLDGELVFLKNTFKASFSEIQTRGRMRSKERIADKALSFPCQLLIFDCLVINGKHLQNEPYLYRKEQLTTLFTKLELPLIPDEKNKKALQLIPYYNSFQQIWDKVVDFNGEGIIAKRESSKWIEGKRTNQWVKYKNLKYILCFITAYEKSNGYFYVGVYHEETIISIGQVLFGLRREEKQALIHIIKNNKSREDSHFIYVEPAICLEVKYLEMYEKQMREPHFHQFKFDINPVDCTLEQLIVQQQRRIPSEPEITHPDKPLWKEPAIKKIDYIHYLMDISSHMLPFLKNRLLTVIRYPHGIFGEPFYQKNCPSYAPKFVETKMVNEINYIVCNQLETFLWLGNQLAFEFHIPFQTINSFGPSEIVFDLDPPSRKDFILAIKAAQLIKEIFDELKLIGFVKTSGNKGLQIYLPLKENTFSFEETRLFTSFIADYLVSKRPDLFTIERLKKKRRGKLYIDYIQHAEGKTIIAPYSPRGTNEATIATPLYWEEVSERLKIEDFQIPNMLTRINNVGDPFRSYFETKEKQNFAPVLSFLKDNTFI